MTPTSVLSKQGRPNDLLPKGQHVAEVSIDPELEQEMEFGVSHDAGLDSANHQTPMVVGVSQLAASMQRKEEEPSNIAIETAMQQEPPQARRSTFGAHPEPFQG